MTEKRTTRTPGPVAATSDLSLPPPLDLTVMTEVASAAAVLRTHVANSLAQQPHWAELLEAAVPRAAAAHAVTCPERSCPVLSAVLNATACDARGQTQSAELMLGAAFTLDADDALAALAAVTDAVPSPRRAHHSCG